MDKKTEKIIKEISIGAPLEIIVYKNAKYDEGKTAMGWKEYEGIRGYFFSGDMLNERGDKILGYLKKINQNSIDIGDDSRDLRVEFRVIHSYKQLEPC